jgi:hypothetical protein
MGTVRPPHTNNREPLHTALCWARALGAPSEDMGRQLLDVGSKTPPSPQPVFPQPCPPHTIRCLPVQSPACDERGPGAPALDSACQAFVPGSCWAPSPQKPSTVQPAPPQTNTRSPAQTPNSGGEVTGASSRANARHVPMGAPLALEELPPVAWAGFTLRSLQLAVTQAAHTSAAARQHARAMSSRYHGRGSPQLNPGPLMKRLTAR